MSFPVGPKPQGPNLSDLWSRLEKAVQAPQTEKKSTEKEKQGAEQGALSQILQMLQKNLFEADRSQDAQKLLGTPPVGAPVSKPPPSGGRVTPPAPATDAGASKPNVGFMGLMPGFSVQEALQRSGLGPQGQKPEDSGAAPPASEGSTGTFPQMPSLAQPPAGGGGLFPKGFKFPSMEQPPVGTPAQPGQPSTFPMMPGGGENPFEALQKLQQLGNTAPPNPLEQLQRLQQNSDPVQSARNRANHAFSEVKVPADHPYKQHVNGVRESLQKAGLPTNADGVRLLAIDNADHGDEVMRAAAGEVGLARGADAQLHLMQPMMQKPAGSNISDAEHMANVKDHLEVFQALEGNTLNPETMKLEPGGLANKSFDQLADLGAQSEIVSLRMRGQQVAHALEQIPNDGKTSVVNMSWGMSPAKYAGKLAERAFKAPPGSALHTEATQILGHAPSQTDANQDGMPDDLVALHKHLAERIETKRQSPAHQKAAQGLRDGIAAQLSQGRKEGVLFVASAGNDAVPASLIGKPELSANYSNNIPGLLTVGGAAPYDNTKHKPGEVPWNFQETLKMSSAGADVSAPGVMPIFDDIPAARQKKDSHGRLLAGTASGTSFSSPYVASVAALMIKANPSITPDQIESILTNPEAMAHNDPSTTRDGAGMIDVTKAVQMASNLGK